MSEQTPTSPFEEVDTPAPKTAPEATPTPEAAPEAAPEATPEAAPEANADKYEPVPTSRTSGKICSSLGAICTLVAWALLLFTAHGAIACAAAGLLLSCFGLRKMSRGWRDLSITAIIASAVLLLIFVVFFTALHIALKQLAG